MVATVLGTSFTQTESQASQVVLGKQFIRLLVAVGVGEQIHSWSFEPELEALAHSEGYEVGLHGAVVDRPGVLAGVPVPLEAGLRIRLDLTRI